MAPIFDFPGLQDITLLVALPAACIILVCFLGLGSGEEVLFSNLDSRYDFNVI